MPTVRQVCEEHGIKRRALWEYVRLGLLKPRGSGIRTLSDQDAERVTFIRNAQAMGFSLTEIAKFDGAIPQDRIQSMVRKFMRSHDVSGKRLAKLRAYRTGGE